MLIFLIRLYMSLNPFLILVLLLLINSFLIMLICLKHYIFFIYSLYIYIYVIIIVYYNTTFFLGIFNYSLLDFIVYSLLIYSI